MLGLIIFLRPGNHTGGVTEVVLTSLPVAFGDVLLLGCSHSDPGTTQGALLPYILYPTHIKFNFSTILTAFTLILVSEFKFKI